MPQLGGRAKQLKGVAFDNRLSITNPANGDLIVYNSTSGLFENTRTLPASITVQGNIATQTLSASGAITGASIALSGSITATNGSFTGTVTAVTGSFTNLTLSNNLSLAGNLIVAGTLSGTGFAFSGSGTISGTATIGTLVVTGNETIAGTLGVVGVVTASAGILTTNINATGSGAFNGGLTASSVGAVTIAASGDVSGATVTADGTVITSSSITILEQDTDVVTTSRFTITRGAYTLLSLRAAGVIEGTGTPNGVQSAETGSLYLRSDATDPNATVYIKTGTGTMGWAPIRDSSQDFEYLFMRLKQLEEALMNVLNDDGSVGIFIDGD